MQTALHMSIYRYLQFRRALKAAPFKGQFMKYAWGELPHQLPFAWMPYSEMFEEFAREIANAINDLTRYTHQLSAWRDVVAPLNDDRRMSVAHEFVDPLGTVALNLPYVVRSRLIFATAHLCHQANHSRQQGWKDDLPLDKEIYFTVADKCGATWTSYSELKTSLEKIGAKEFQRATGDFRNAYNHRFSPRVVIGQTQVVTRRIEPETGLVQYGFGGKDALTLETVVRLLDQQCAYCYKAFEAFQKLVKEHEAAIVYACHQQTK